MAILLRKRLLDSLAKNDENFIGIYTKLKVVLKLLKRKKFFNCSKNEAIFFVKLLNGSQLRVFSYRIFPSKKWTKSLEYMAIKGRVSFDAGASSPFIVVFR